ncbi:MAG TPA: tetratricopeptide repeat protein, partial [Gemmatimonadales bacterium]
GMEDLAHGFFNRGSTRINRAVELDPAFGLARVINGVFAPGLTAAQREADITRGVADAAKASTGELLVAMAYRENFRQNALGARSLLMAAGSVLPAEPYVMWQRAVWAANVPGGTQTDAIPELRRLIERFPEYAPAYNTLAYAQWRAGNQAEAIRTAATFMQKASGQPKAHDTYAELLQWDGRYDDAVKHYTAAIEADKTFLAGFFGLAEVQMLQGKGDLARTTLTASLPNSTVPAQRVAAHNRIANSYVLDGNTKAALTAFVAALGEAQKANLTGQVVGAHVAMMNLEAALGDSKNVPAHVEHLRAIPPPPVVTPQQRAGVYLGTGTAFAMAGQTAPARMQLDSLTQHAKTNSGPQVTAQLHQLTGWVLYSEGKFAEALAEFRQGNPQNASVRSGIALSQFKLGNVVEARSIRDELVNDRNLNMANSGNVLARRLVKQRIT